MQIRYPWASSIVELISGETKVTTGSVYGTQVSIVGAAFSFAGGATFGGFYGSTTPGDMGIPIQGTIFQSVGKGVSMGLVSGAAGVTVTF